MATIWAWRDREHRCRIQRTITAQHQVCLWLKPMSRFLLLYIYKIYIYLQEGVPFACRLCLTVSETNDSQKRRRLEAAGQENHCPEASSSGRRAELETKPDTPIVPSVRSRVQQLTQRRDGKWLFSAYKFMHAEYVTKYLTDLYSTVVTKPSQRWNLLHYWLCLGC